MKLILSRKGFDSAAGGGPSPLLPGDRPVSLPIPSEDDLSYRDVAGPDGRPLATLMRRLRVPERTCRGRCHLDPDLDAAAVPRAPGWRPAFGSVAAAGTHLGNHGVGAGDLFLFFGWFRRFEEQGRRLAPVPGSDVHLVFGYLQVGEVHRPAEIEEVPDYLRSHPHCGSRLLGRTGNVLFEAADRLRLPGATLDLPGAGLLPYADERVLTAPGRTRSRWRLPREVFGGVEISYHTQRAWRDGYFQSAGRGQEFVLEADEATLAWAGAMIEGETYRGRTNR